MNRKALHTISYGLYILSSVKNDEEYNGQIANTVFQVTSEPPAIACCVNKENLTHEFINDSGVFAASVLSKEAPMSLIGTFGFRSGRDIDKFSDIDYVTKKTGAPIPTENVLSYIEAEVTRKIDLGSHTMFIGKVIDAEVLAEGEPMTYSYYHEVKGGTAPKAAPTHIEEEETQSEENVQKYRCTVCGYVYDPKKGDPDSGIEPGVSFEDLPEDWVCPVCGASKEKFEPV